MNLTYHCAVEPSNPRTPEQFDSIRHLVGWDDWIFRDAIFLALRVPLDPKKAAAMLPWGLKLSRPATATLFVAHFPESSFGSTYNEVGLFVDVRHLGRPAAHCPWMLVDDDIALIVGRELLGYPKKLGHIDLEITEDRVAARVERRGQELLTLQATIGTDTVPEPAPMLGRRAVNVWGLLGLSLPRLLSFTPREEVVEARVAEATFELGDSLRDPLGKFGIGPASGAILYRVNVGAHRRFPIPGLPVSPAHLIRHLGLRYQ